MLDAGVVMAWVAAWPSDHLENLYFLPFSVWGGAEMVTCDRRAEPVYERYGLRVVFV